jgi:hypothetical protein
VETANDPWWFAAAKLLLEYVSDDVFARVTTDAEDAELREALAIMQRTAERGDSSRLASLDAPWRAVGDMPPPNLAGRELQLTANTVDRWATESDGDECARLLAPRSSSSRRRAN